MPQRNHHHSVFLCLLCLGALAFGMKPMESCKTGSITYYTGFDSGSCGFESLTGETGPGYTTCAALNEAMLGGAEKCGVCYEIVGPLGAMRVMVTDRCPAKDTPCSGGMTHFDLTGSDTFAKVQDVKAGLSNITYRMVSCDVSGNIKAKIKPDSTQYWASFLFFNHKTQLTKVEYKTASGSWAEISRTTYNQYEISSPPVPFEVRLTSVTGDTVTHTFNSIDAGGIIDLGDQFDDVDWNYGGASKGCCTPPNNWATVIGDSLEGIWSDWSYSTTTSVDASSPHSGAACLKVSVNAAWGGFQAGSDFGPSSADFSGISFYLKRDQSTASSAKLTFSFGGVGNKQEISDIPTQWTKYSFEKTDMLSGSEQITTISLQSSVAGTYYLDDMVFELSGGGLTPKCADGVDNGGSSQTSSSSSSGTTSGSGGGKTPSGGSGSGVTPGSSGSDKQGSASTLRLSALFVSLVFFALF